MAQKVNDIQHKQRSVRNIKTKGGNGDNDNLSSPPPERSRKPSSGGIWFVVITLVLFLFFGLSVAFSDTRIVVYPNVESVETEGEYTAMKEADPSELQYEIMTITREGGMEVSAQGEEEISQKAAGQITIYNDYQSEPFRLVNNTRFEGTNNKIYRIQESVSIPGRSNSAPGTITVDVVADQAGQEYNLKTGKLTVPGLEGDASYDSVYAEVTSSISGGFDGVRKTVSKEDEQNARAALQSQMGTQLSKEAQSQKPDGFILYDDATFLSFSSLPNESKDSQVVVKERATLKGIIFENEDFAEYLARKHIEGYEGEEVTIQNPSELTFSLQEKEGIDLANEESILFTLSGTAKLEWVIDNSAVREDFANRHKNDTQTILSKYPSIERANVIMRPFWRRTFPANPEEIEIKKVVDE